MKQTSLILLVAMSLCACATNGGSNGGSESVAASDSGRKKVCTYERSSSAGSRMERVCRYEEASDN